MQTETMIPAKEFCTHHHVELSFIYALRESGLIETVIIEEQVFLPLDQLGHIEKLVRLHYEMDINLEGIETIAHLLERIETMQLQMLQLGNKLNMYENQFNF